MMIERIINPDGTETIVILPIRTYVTNSNEELPKDCGTCPNNGKCFRKCETLPAEWEEQ
jgi:hypothetical protein